MLADLLRCSTAMPMKHADVLDDALSAACDESRRSNTMREGMVLARSVLVLARAEHRQPGASEVIETALCRLARFGAADWRDMRQLLLDAYDENIESQSIPIAAWLKELVVEIDGRRLDIEVELARLAAGR